MNTKDAMIFVAADVVFACLFKSNDMYLGNLPEMLEQNGKSSEFLRQKQNVCKDAFVFLNFLVHFISKLMHICVYLEHDHSDRGGYCSSSPLQC